VASRRSFIGAGIGGAAAILCATPTSAAESSPPGGGRALIHTGGVNRGAYQAGVVRGLAEVAGLRDGQPLPYDLISGSSIGALNAYLVATAQYERLREVWREVASRPLFALKPRYAKVATPSSGIATRLEAAISLAFGLAGRTKGVVDPGPIRALLAEYVDPAFPIHVPTYFSATNLTRKRTEIFVLRGTSAGGIARQERLDPILEPLRRIVLHPVVGEDVRAALFASSALPIVFDPVRVARADGSGKSDEYIDGGLADNVPIDVARRCATTIDIVGVDPPASLEEEADYANAAGIGSAVFGIMQTRIIQQTVKLAYAESLLAAGAKRRSLEIEDEELPILIRYLRPSAPLPGRLGDFTDLAALDAMQEIGRSDALRGWQPFNWLGTYG
jgi:NTE family protein